MRLPPSALRTFWSHFTWWNNHHQYKTVFNLPANIKRTKKGREFFCLNGCFGRNIMSLNQLIEYNTSGGHVRSEQMWFFYLFSFKLFIDISISLQKHKIWKIIEVQNWYCECCVEMVLCRNNVSQYFEIYITWYKYHRLSWFHMPEL